MSHDNESHLHRRACLNVGIALGIAACAPKGAAGPSDDGRHAAHDHEGHHANHAHGHGGGHGHDFKDAAAWSQVFDDPARDEWQRPDDILRVMALTPSMAVADVGAGTGYFSVRLARAVPSGRVFAVDVEPDMIRYLTERAAREGLPHLVAVRGTQAASGLAAKSVDRILVVDVWHHLEDRASYARDLATALRPGGRIFVVDFTLAARRGPPAELRIAPESVISELAASGLTASAVSIALPDQYVVEARRTE